MRTQAYMCQGKHVEVRGHPQGSILPSTLLVTVSCSLLHAPGTPSKSSVCCSSPLRDTLESQMCAAVSGLMWIQGIQTQTIRFAQQAPCPLGHLSSPFLGFLEVELTDCEMHKLNVPFFSELDGCRHLCNATVSL